LGALINFENPDIKLRLLDVVPIPLNPPIGFFTGIYFFVLFFCHPRPLLIIKTKKQTNKKIIKSKS